jgi:hypothetical protein
LSWPSSSTTPVSHRRSSSWSTVGHEVGLHFSAGDDVAFRLRLLSELLGAPVRSYAQHDPANAGFVQVQLPGCVDAYRVVRDHELLYVSESAKLWREHTFETALEQDRNLCLSAHAHSWLRPEDDYVAMSETSGPVVQRP